jgi:DNA-binding GntR family transcriptional regulator
MGSEAVRPLLRTMSAQLTALVRSRIVSGAYAPGAALPQDALAAEFGVSKIPVREALLQLRAEGLVDVFAHRGFQVRSLTQAEAHEIFRLRLALEPQAIARGAQLAGPLEREGAEAAARELRQALEEDRLEDAGDRNGAFHLALLVPARQRLTAEVLQRLLTLAQRYVRLHLQPIGRASRARREHEALLAAWTAGDAARAEELARLHIHATYEDLIRVFGTDAARV